MGSIVVVEDDDRKRAAVRALVSVEMPFEDVYVADSFRSGIVVIESVRPELVVLDMSIPTFRRSSGPSRDRAFGGWDIVDEMQRRRIRSDVIFVTQFRVLADGDVVFRMSDIAKQVRQSIGTRFHGVVRYEESSSAWRENLQDLLRVYKGL